MAAYATAADFEAYVEGWTTTNSAALDRLLERATRDIDAVMGPRAVIRIGTYAGLKFDPTTLADWERAALSRAVCAQAEYRNTVGEGDWAAAGGGGRVTGPDFTVDRPTNGTGGRIRIGPKVPGELAPIAHLRITRGVLGQLGAAYPLL